MGTSRPIGLLQMLRPFSTWQLVVLFLDGDLSRRGICRQSPLHWCIVKHLTQFPVVDNQVYFQTLFFDCSPRPVKICFTPLTSMAILNQDCWSYPLIGASFVRCCVGKPTCWKEGGKILLSFVFVFVYLCICICADSASFVRCCVGRAAFWEEGEETCIIPNRVGRFLGGRHPADAWQLQPFIRIELYSILGRGGQRFQTSTNLAGYVGFCWRQKTNR